MKQAMLITGTLGTDAHVIGTKILSRALRDAGFNVVELGILTPPEEFIKAALENKADAILMSSLYGMGENDVQGFKEKCVQAGLGDVLLYIGGNLGVGRHACGMLIFTGRRSESPVMKSSPAIPMATRSSALYLL